MSQSEEKVDRAMIETEENLVLSKIGQQEVLVKEVEEITMREMDLTTEMI